MSSLNPYFKTKEYIDFINTIIPKIKELLNKQKKNYIYDNTLFGINTPQYIELLQQSYKVKRVQMNEGIISQLIIGNFPAWEDLGTGHYSGLDCRKKDNSIILELKNKWNTCNSASEKTLKDKLVAYKKNNPNTRCIWGIINPKKNTKKLTQIIKYNGFEIEKIQGIDLFKLVFNINDEQLIYKIIDNIKNIIYN